MTSAGGGDVVEERYHLTHGKRINMLTKRNMMITLYRSATILHMERDFADEDARYTQRVAASADDKIKRTFTLE